MGGLGRDGHVERDLGGRSDLDVGLAAHHLQPPVGLVVRKDELPVAAHDLDAAARRRVEVVSTSSMSSSERLDLDRVIIRSGSQLAMRDIDEPGIRLWKTYSAASASSAATTPTTASPSTKAASPPAACPWCSSKRRRRGP